MLGPPEPIIPQCQTLCEQGAPVAAFKEVFRVLREQTSSTPLGASLFEQADKDVENMIGGHVIGEDTREALLGHCVFECFSEHMENLEKKDPELAKTGGRFAAAFCEIGWLSTGYALAVRRLKKRQGPYVLLSSVLCVCSTPALQQGLVR
jgi:hypothetical protein